MLQAVAIVKTIPFMNLEEDYEAEQTCNRHTRAGKRKHLKSVLKKKRRKKTSQWLVLVLLSFLVLYNVNTY